MYESIKKNTHNFKLSHVELWWVFQENSEKKNR